ncbi:hypothetical protein PtB15_8B148 [Puccinia triticina]|nr:hypothetical protein PtB15_8B148 [Puccinia triticina]
MVESTRAKKSSAKNVNKNASTNKDRQDNQAAGECRGEETLISDGRTESRNDVAPGPEPVNKSTGGDLGFEEDDIVKSNLKGNTPMKEEPEFVDLIKSMPIVEKLNTDAKSILIEQAIAALNAGNTSVASVLMKAANKIKLNKSRVSGLESTAEDSQDGGLIYADVGTTHVHFGYAPFLDENIKKLRGPLPLTIFNKLWRHNAMSWNLEKQPKSKELTNSSYKGFPFVPEWHMTHMHWTFNHRDFYQTLAEVYNNKKFADMLLEHKKNVDFISDTQSS